MISVDVLKFSLFFVVYFSIFYLMPLLLLKNLVKKSRKKKNPDKIKDITIYAIMSIVYIISFIVMAYYFKDGVDFYTENGILYGLVSDPYSCLLSSLIYLVIAFIYIYYTFYLSSKFMSYKENETAYSVVGVTGFLNIIIYYYFYSILNLDYISYGSSIGVSDLILKLDLDFVAYLFFLLVAIKFALSFLQK